MATDKNFSKIKKEIGKNSSFEAKASFFKCIGDETCLKILYVLSKDRNVCVSDITDVLSVSMPAVSHQLSKLKAMGIVKTVRKGQNICYSLSNTDNAKLVKNFLYKNIN